MQSHIHRNTHNNDSLFKEQNGFMIFIAAEGTL